MSISFPLTTLFSGIDFTDQTFQPVPRQELSRQANGRTIGKDFGSAAWMVSYTTAPLTTTDALTFESLLDTLDGVTNTFEAFDLRRPFPLAYPTGAFTDSGQLNSVNANNKALSLKLLPAGYLVSVGDYLSFTYGTSRALHRVMEAVTANGSGLTTEFEVRPHIRPGWALSTAVALKAPRGLFVLVPGSVTPRTDGEKTIISFQAVQYLE